MSFQHSISAKMLLITAESQAVTSRSPTMHRSTSMRCVTMPLSVGVIVSLHCSYSDEQPTLLPRGKLSLPDSLL